MSKDDIETQARRAFFKSLEKARVRQIARSQTFIFCQARNHRQTRHIDMTTSIIPRPAPRHIIEQSVTVKTCPPCRRHRRTHPLPSHNFGDGTVMNEKLFDGITLNGNRMARRCQRHMVKRKMETIKLLSNNFCNL